MNNNPINNLKSFISNGGTPQQFIEKMIVNNSNPMLLNLVQMAQKGDKQGIENFARNLYKEQGRDFDKEFNEFMNYFK